MVTCNRQFVENYLKEGSAQKKFGRNPERTFWVPTWNREPPGTHFLDSYLEPVTHFGPICLEPGTPIFEIRVGSTRNPGPMGSWVPHMPTPDLKEKSYHV